MASEVNCEWGRQGLDRLVADSDVVIIVDVLSFSTCVDIAVSRGGFVVPTPWNDSRAGELATALSAKLAGQRGAAQFSLSPTSFFEIETSQRVVLPSPNGGALTVAAAGRATVLAGCLRNAVAVARAACRLGSRIAIIPAGERWPDHSLRPCLEDWLGAGAILDEMAGSISAEGEAARESFRAARADLPRILLNTVSGIELAERDYSKDVEVAADVNCSNVVPILKGKEFLRLDH